MKIKIWLASLIAIVIIVGTVVAYDYKQFINSPLNITSNGSLHLDVKIGRSITSIANELANKGMITHPYYLAWAARLNGQAKSIQAGEYEIEKGVTPQQLLALLVTGKVRQYSFTIIEGWNVAQVLNAINENTYLTHLIGTVPATQLMSKLGSTVDLHAEGWLFPDTYYFVRGESDVNVLLRAHDAMKRNLTKAWESREKNLPYKTPYDALIMASIIEKETGRGDERQQIAGVFVRRLRKGMKLQTDPTVIYGIGDKYDGNIRRRDLRKDTPYNTYTRRGLPPTPIAMPGLAAIEAALHPAKGKALYFVAKGDGSHVFSSTLKQHNNAVIKYQLKGRRKEFSSYSVSDKE